MSADKTPEIMDVYVDDFDPTLYPPGLLSGLSEASEPPAVAVPAGMSVLSIPFEAIKARFDAMGSAEDWPVRCAVGWVATGQQSSERIRDCVRRLGSQVISGSATSKWDLDDALAMLIIHASHLAGFDSKAFQLASDCPEHELEYLTGHCDMAICTWEVVHHVAEQRSLVSQEKDLAKAMINASFTFLLLADVEAQIYQKRALTNYSPLEPTLREDWEALLDKKSTEKIKEGDLLFQMMIDNLYNAASEIFATRDRVLDGLTLEEASWQLAKCTEHATKRMQTINGDPVAKLAVDAASHCTAILISLLSRSNAPLLEKAGPLFEFGSSKVIALNIRSPTGLTGLTIRCTRLAVSIILTNVEWTHVEVSPVMAEKYTYLNKLDVTLKHMQ